MNSKVYVDMMNRAVTIPIAPNKIISLVPSQSELLFDLGLDNEVIGITKFCIHPLEWHQSKIKVGGTKKLHLSKIKELKPDLIIANKEENSQSDIEELAKAFPVWISDIKTMEDALRMIAVIGDITQKQSRAVTLIEEIRKAVHSLQTNSKPKRVAYFIWRKPWMTIGEDTFINDILKLMNWVNVYHHHSRYPETNLEELKQHNPEIILLSSEPYPFQQKHLIEIQEKIPNAKILLVDGEMFSWYGSRLKKAIFYLQDLITSPNS